MLHKPATMRPKREVLLQIRQVAAVTISRTFRAHRERRKLMLLRVAVLKVQRAGLALLLRAWERRFGQFLSIEQAALIVGRSQLAQRMKRARGTAQGREVLVRMCFPSRRSCDNRHKRSYTG
jgi:hypothetical protein